MKIEVSIGPSYEDNLDGCYHAVVDTDQVISVPEALVEGNSSIRHAVETKGYPLFGGIARLKLKKLGGMACLWGDSESEDAEFTPVKGGEEKDYLVPVLLCKRDDKFVYHTRIVILDTESEHILEPYRDMLLPVRRVR